MAQEICNQYFVQLKKERENNKLIVILYKFYLSCLMSSLFFSLQTFGGQGQTAGEFFIVKHFQSFGGGTQSPAVASLCLREARERKK